MSVKFKICSKEPLYLTLMIITGLVLYIIFFILMLSPSMQVPDTSIESTIGQVVAIIFILGFYKLISQTLFLGYLRGNSIMASNQQFPEIYNIVKEQSAALNLIVPKVYIQESGGILNAFAGRFFGHHYVILYSDILEAVYEEGGLEAVKFVIGHELGHIKSNHLNPWLRLIFLPTIIIPFLPKAYWRAAEYSCDNIGYALAPQGAVSALLIISAGKKLYKNVNIEEHIKSYNEQRGFATWFAELLSTHPHLVNRISSLRSQE